MMEDVLEEILEGAGLLEVFQQEQEEIKAAFAEEEKEQEGVVEATTATTPRRRIRSKYYQKPICSFIPCLLLLFLTHTSSFFYSALQKMIYAWYLWYFGGRRTRMAA